MPLRFLGNYTPRHWPGSIGIRTAGPAGHQRRAARRTRRTEPSTSARSRRAGRTDAVIDGNDADSFGVETRLGGPAGPCASSTGRRCGGRSRWRRVIDGEVSARSAEYPAPSTRHRTSPRPFHQRWPARNTFERSDHHHGSTDIGAAGVELPNTRAMVGLGDSRVRSEALSTGMKIQMGRSAPPDSTWPARSEAPVRTQSTSATSLQCPRVAGAALTWVCWRWIAALTLDHADAVITPAPTDSGCHTRRADSAPGTARRGRAAFRCVRERSSCRGRGGA